MQSLLVLDVLSMFTYLSGSDPGGSMTNILINENLLWLLDHIDDGLYLKSVSEVVVSLNSLQNYQ